jgi:phosphoglycolate phosphatase
LTSPSRASLPAAIVFDFDLTLADSLPGFVQSHGHAATQLNLPVPPPEAIGRLIGTPLPIAVRQLYHFDSDAAADSYIRLYQAHADRVMAGLTTVLPGVSDSIDALYGAGIALGVLSQKLRYRIEDVLRRESLLDRFGVVFGGEDLPDFKPDPRGLLLAIDRLGATPATGLYVGDTLIDAEAAKRAGVPFIAVLTGFTTRAEFAPYTPTAILDSVASLPAHLGL